MSSKVQHCRPAEEVLRALLESGETLETLAEKIGASAFTLSRYTSGVYGSMTSYPTLRKKIEDVYGKGTGLFDPEAEIRLPKTDAASALQVSPASEPVPVEGPKKPARAAKKEKEKKPMAEERITPAPEGFMEIPGTADEAAADAKPAKRANPAPDVEKAETGDTAALPDDVPGQLAFGDVFGNAVPKLAEEKPLTYDQMSSKLQSELCASVKTAFASLKESHRDAIPKKPVFAGKEASELVDIIAKLSTEDIKVLLAMARRMI